MGELSPFERVFNPDFGRDTVLGGLGNMFGNQSQQGNEQATALKTLSELTDQTGSPQKAILQFLQQPEGQKLFAGNPQAFENTIKQFITTVTPPAPAINSVGPGQQQTSTDNFSGQTKPTVFNPAGSFNVSPGDVVATPSATPGGMPRAGYENPRNAQIAGAGSAIIPPGATEPSSIVPTERVQTQAGYVKGANLSPEESNQSYTDLAFTPEGKVGLAVNRMVKQGVMTPADGEMFKAGGLEWKQEHGPFGTVVGWGLYDKNGKRRAFHRGDIPSELKQPDQADEGFNPADPKASMHLGSGALNMGRDQLGRAGRMTIGNSALDAEGSQLVAERRNAILGVHEALTEAAKIGGVRSGAIKALINLAPETGLNVDASLNLKKMIALHQGVTREIGEAEATIRGGDPYASPEVIKQASQTRDALQHVLRTLPTPKQMTQAKAICDKGDCGDFKALDALNLGKKEFNAVTGRGAAPDPASFATMTPEQINAVDDKTLDKAGRDALRQRMDTLRGAGSTPQAPAAPVAPPAPAPIVAPPRAGMQQRREQANQGRMQFQPEDGSGPSVPQYLRNPDGSMTVSPDRINQAFEVLAEAHRQGFLTNGDPGPVRKASPAARKRQQSRQ